MQGLQAALTEARNHLVGTDDKMRDSQWQHAHSALAAYIHLDPIAKGIVDELWPKTFLSVDCWCNQVPGPDYDGFRMFLFIIISLDNYIVDRRINEADAAE